MIGLARQLSPDRLVLVANKVRSAREREAVERLAADEDIAVAGVVPYDPQMLQADLAVRALLDFDPRSPSAMAIDELAAHLLAQTAPAV